MSRRYDRVPAEHAAAPTAPVLPMGAYRTPAPVTTTPVAVGSGYRTLTRVSLVVAGIAALLAVSTDLAGAAGVAAVAAGAAVGAHLSRKLVVKFTPPAGRTRR